MSVSDYLSNVQIELITAAYTHCWPEWRDIDYTPKYNKFYYICDGAGWLKIDGAEYYPLPGQLFLMPANVIQSYSTMDNKVPFTKYWCHFNAKVGEFDLFDIIRIPHYVEVGNDSSLSGFFKVLVENKKNNDISSIFKVKSALYGIISFFVGNTAPENICIRKPKSLNRLEPVLNYINEHISSGITIDDLAGLIHFHPTHFIRYFRKCMGITPMQYIRKIKLEKVKTLLFSTDYSISEIADMVGYKNQFHLSKDFRQFTGYSPTGYKKVIANRA